MNPFNKLACAGTGAGKAGDRPAREPGGASRRTAWDLVLLVAAGFALGGTMAGLWSGKEGIARALLSWVLVSALVCPFLYCGLRWWRSRRDDDRAAVEESLRRAAERSRAVFEGAPDGLLTLTTDGLITLMNPALEKMTGWPRTEWIGKFFQPLVHPDDLPLALEALRRTRDGEEVPPFELRILAEPGGSRTLEFFARRMAWPGEDPGVIVAVRDVTVRKAVDTEVRAAKMRLHLATRASHIGTWEWDLATREAHFSPEWKRQIGHEDSEIAPKYSEWESRLHPGDRERVLGALAAYLRGDRPDFDVEFRLRHKDGSYRWIATRGEVIRDRDGRPQRMYGCHVDVTGRRGLGLEHALLRQAAGQVAESIVVTDPAGDVVYVNPAFERATGYSLREIAGRNARLLMSGKHDSAFYRALRAALERGETWRGRIINRRKNGSEFHEETVIAPVRDAAGHAVNYVAVQHAAAGQPATGTQARQMHKLDVLGRLAGGVAHDFNNILAAIDGHCAILRESLPPEGGLREHADCIATAARTARGVAGPLLALSRGQERNPVATNLNELVGGCARMLNPLLGRKTTLVTHLAADIGSAKVDPVHLEQVLVNLVVNACDALPNGGVIHITTSNAALGEEYTRLHADASAGAYVLIEVADNGCGMTGEVMARIFEPFFTTKPEGRGTGLGLAICYGIVKQCGGHIAVQSEPGEGSRFRVYLPLVPDDAVQDVARAEPHQLPC